MKVAKALSTALRLSLLNLLGCAHARTPAQTAMLKRADCAELLLAADQARAAEDPGLAHDLVRGCAQDQLSALVNSAPTPALALLWCGRARAGLGDNGKPSCASRQISDLSIAMHTPISLGPSDPGAEPDRLLIAVLGELAAETGLRFEKDDPQVYLGRLTVALEHTTSNTIASVTDSKGRKQRVPATAHRFVARAEIQLELGGKTRTLRASEEVRDVTWAEVPKLAVAARFTPVVPAEDELKHKAALTLVRSIAKALAAAPPETVDTSDVRGCVTYGRALNLGSNDPTAAARGVGDRDKIAACEELLEEPAGAGIPAP